MGFPRGSLFFAALLSTSVYGQEWKESSWGKLQPSKDLNWVDCYPGGFQCTRLQVPLNYSQPDGNSAAIALVRLPANVSVDSAEYGGPVLFNPGGPGVGGVNFVVQAGATLLRKSVGAQFDLVGFDPRGVGRSTPGISYFTSKLDRSLNFYPTADLNSTAEPIPVFVAQSKLTGAWAAERNGDVLAHMNTPNTATDMVSILEAYGVDRLKYWGFSYGTVLGATFAAMYPDKVERLIIDGVVDVQDDYYTTEWFNGLVDMQKTIDWFFRSCLEAGPDVCAFHEPSIPDMQTKFDCINHSLHESPIVVHTNISSGLIDYGILRITVLTQMYAPFSWSDLAKGLQSLANGDGEAFFKLYLEAGYAGQDDVCLTPGEPAFEDFETTADAVVSYICTDGEAIPGTIEDAERHYRKSVELSPLGSLWASHRIACSGWSTDIPKPAFRGPIAGNTSFPMLIIGNTADPVTSLASAINVSKGFPGSVVLVQDSPGHASVSAPSACTTRVIQEYFANGTLPKEGTVCPMDRGPFDVSATSDAGIEKKRSIDRDELAENRRILMDIARDSYLRRK